MDEEAEAARVTKHLSAATQKASKVTGWAWDVERTWAVSAMGQLLQLGINRLWPMSCPEEQLVNLFTRVAYLLLVSVPLVTFPPLLSRFGLPHVAWQGFAVSPSALSPISSPGGPRAQAGLRGHTFRRV